MDDRFITTIGAVGSIFNGLSRVFAGWLMDRYRFKDIYSILLTVQIVVCGTMTFVCSWNKWIYFIWVLLGYSCLGAHFVLFPTEMVRTFGIRSGSQLYSLLYIGIGVGQISILFGNQYLTAIYKSNVYYICYNMFVCLTLVSVITLIKYKPEQIRRQQDNK